MYCKKCGAPTGSDATLCRECARENRPVRRKPKGFLHTVKGYMPLIVLAMAVIALVFGVLNVFSVFNVLGISTNGDERITEYGTVKEMDELLGYMDTSFGAGYVGNIIFGLTCLLAATVGVLYALKRTMNLPFYGMFVGRFIGFIGGPGFAMGALVVIGGLLQLLFYGFCRAEMTLLTYTITVKAGVNWTTWLIMVLFAALLVLDLILPKKKKRR